MPTDEILIRQIKRLYEEKTGWGDSGQWSNQDFLQLSEMIRGQTGVTISHVTLKRIWGKVRYESLPNTHTLNTLVQFVGYDSWRDFSVRNAGLLPHASPSNGHNPGSAEVSTNGHSSPTADSTNSHPPSSASPATNGHPIPAAGSAHDNGLPPSSAAASPANGHSSSTAAPSATPAPTNGHPAPTAGNSSTTRPKRTPASRLRKISWILIPLVVIMGVLLYLHGQQPSPLSPDYPFTRKKVVSTGVPNSVVFDYDASRAPTDSVVIQQSWDTTRRVKVPKNGRQYTSVYYYPDFFHATLQVQGKVVKTHNLLIETNGWVPIVHHEPVPVYFTPQDVMKAGKMTLPIEKIKEKNIPMQPSPPSVWFCNVRDFGEIYSDHFTFETSLKNDFSEGSAICQATKIYILCQGTAIWVPLCAKGCISDLDLYFTYFYTSGKHDDLSAFGVDFSKYVKLRIESDSGHAKIFVNDHLAYTVPRHILHSRIIGIDFNFQGTGSVDYVSLTNGKVDYRDDF